MDRGEDELSDSGLDELALDNPGPPCHASRRLGTSNRGSSGTTSRCAVQNSSTPTPTPPLQTSHANMSSSRYPKRRRVSEREAEATAPPVPSLPTTSQHGEKQTRRDSSPDELAPNSPHTNTRSNRANSRPKRGGKTRKKSLPEIHKATASPIADKTDANDLSIGAAVPEASDDELDITAAAAVHYPEETQDRPAALQVQHEGNNLDEQANSAPNQTIDDPKDEDEDKTVAPPVDNAVEKEVDTVPLVEDTSEAIIADTPALDDDLDSGTAAVPSVDDAPEESTAVPPVEDTRADNTAGVSLQDNMIEEQHAPTTEPIADHPFKEAVAQPSIEEPPHIEVPLRRRSTFKGSFLRVSPPPSPDRYVSKSPPPYSRVSTPVATPRELPPAPPQFAPYKEKMVLKGHRRPVSTVKFSPDGILVASCSGDATIKIWETSTGKLRNTLEGHLAGINTVAWMPDSRIIASGSDDKSICLWYVETGKMHPRKLIGHSSYVFSIAFSPKGNMLASGSYDEALFLWDVRTQRLMRSHPAHSDPISAVDFVFDGTLIVSCSTDGLIRLWDTASGQCLRTLVHEDNAAVSNVCFVRNGKFVLAWTLDSSIRCWNYVDGRCMKTFQGHKNEKYCLAGAHGEYRNKDGTGRRAFVASGSEDGKIYTWDLNSKEVLQVIDGHKGVVLGVDFLWKRGNNLMVSCGMDNTVKIWGQGMDEEEEEERATATINEPDTAVQHSEGEKVPVTAGEGAHTIPDQTADDDEAVPPGFEFIEENVEVAEDEEIIDGVDA